LKILQTLSTKFEGIGIIHVILASFSIHMFVISHPNFEVLDEIFFTNFMRWFMLGIDHSPYQLPGLSFIVSPFVYVFGDNWVSWRFPIIIFGMVFLYFYYKVVEQIFTKKIALMTSVIMAFSPVIFVSSSLMLRDMPVMALGFFAMYLYLKQKYYFSALFIGLSALIKETAIFFVIFITLHYILTNREKISRNIIANRDYFKTIKTPFITLLIILLSFLIPLTIYDNTVTVLEYSTRHPEYFIIDENQELGVYRFDVTKSTSEIYGKSVNDFNYVAEIKDPLHHLYVMFTKGYYDQNDSKSQKFLPSFLPIDGGDTIHHIRYGHDTTSIDEEGFEIHQKEYPTIWVQSMINYSWWHVGFWSCIVLMGYTVFQRIKNNIPVSKEMTFIFCGFSFFIPYLIIDMIRDTFAYYMIYFLPIMATGLVCMIYKIPNKTLRFMIFAAFILAIIGNFLYVFPVWGF
jgi:hypothetical protein